MKVHRFTASPFFVLLFILMVTCIHPLAAQSNRAISKLKIEAESKSLSGYEASVKLVNYYRNHSLDSAVVYSKRAMMISSDMLNDSLYSNAAILLALSYNYKDNRDSVIYYCYLAMNRGRTKAIEAKAMDVLGIAYRRSGNFDSALFCSNKSLRLFDELGDTLRYANTLGNISRVLDEMGKYSEAIKYSVKAAAIFDKLHDNDNLARRYGTIANIYLDMGNNSKGIEYLKRALVLTDENKIPNLYFNIVFNMATVYHDLGLYDSALQMYNRALDHYVRVNDLEGIAIAHQNIGLAFFEKGNPELAIKHLKEGYKLFSKLSTIRNVAYVLSDLGLAYGKTGNLDSSMYYLNKALAMAEKYTLIQEEQRIYYKFYRVYKSMHDFEKALMYYENYRDIADSINNEKIGEKIAELNSKFEADLKDQKIKQLTLNKKVSEAKTRTQLIGGSLFVIIVFLLVSILYYRKHTQTRLLVIKGKLLENEKAELDNELNYKKRLLTSHALHMTQKNQILQNIRKAVNEIIPDVPETTKVKVKKLQNELNRSLRYDKDWEIFSNYFSELNSDFFEKLKTLNPKLTQYDLRLSALLRMNMNIKEAAAVLNIEPDSVKTARYKLRKKLKLSADEDLVEFISKL